MIGPRICKHYGTTYKVDMLTGNRIELPIVVCGRDLQDNMKLIYTENTDKVTCPGCQRGIRELLRTGGN